MSHNLYLPKSPFMSRWLSSLINSQRSIDLFSPLDTVSLSVSHGMDRNATRAQALNKQLIRELPQLDEKQGQLSPDRQWVLL